MGQFVEYAPWLVVVLMFLWQNKVFVTPEQLEKKHREILESIEQRYVSNNSFKDLKNQFDEVKEKIDKIYDMLIKG